MKSIVQQVKAARRVSTPLIAITTPDPGVTIETLCDSLNGESVKIVWDIVQGFKPRGDAAVAAIADMVGEHDPSIGNPLEAFIRAAKLPKQGILFIHLASRWIGDPSVIQAIWNLRDRFKIGIRTLILLAPSIQLPAELAGDVIVFDEPLPDSDALTTIVREVHGSANATVDESVLGKAVEALQGLPAFQAEQVAAMSLLKSGLDIDALWERKRRQIELTPGLKVHREGVKFSDIGGVAVIKDFVGRILAGQARPNAVVFIDEIEKMLAGSHGGGDTSGVSQDQLGSLLSYMQDANAAGMIFVGPPGSAKSMIAKAAGNEGGIPTIQLDLGAMKGSLVGQSEHQLRSALKVITSVSNGRSLWIATCNSIGDLPPELRRRFTLGTFFFDLPDADERKAIWGIHGPARGFIHATIADEGWTGAEIKQCCDIAWRLGIKLKDASAFVVPVARSASEVIDRLRKAANGRFLSASKPGVYRSGTDAPQTPATKRRSIQDGD